MSLSTTPTDLYQTEKDSFFEFLAKQVGRQTVKPNVANLSQGLRLE